MGCADNLYSLKKKKRIGNVCNAKRFGNDRIVFVGVLNEYGSFYIVSLLRQLFRVENEQKIAIMQAISDACGIKSDAKGIVISLPIEDAIGLGD